MSSNRGVSENLTYMNVPIAVADPSGGKGTIYSRPAVETLAPIYTPQVPIVRTETPAFVAAPGFAFQQPTAAPSSPNPLTFAVLVALLVVLVMWIAKLMFKK